MKVLVINTYGGSILLGATAAGADVLGSYEDAGFGSDIQRANFPKVPLVEKAEEWPEWGPIASLRDVVVLAHPPCSAFSVQNANPEEKGIDSEAFACTKRVADYALSRGCAALAIESVTGALEGARVVHEHLARQYGYELHRVLQNAVLFGVPQWRERFWAVLVRKDLAPATMRWTLAPRVVTLGDVLGARAHVVKSTVPQEVVRDHLKLEKKLADRGMDQRSIRALFQDADEHRGPIDGVIHGLYQVEENAMAVHKRYIGGFRSRQLRYLGPGDYAPTLMSDSWWWYAGRPMTLADYTAVMGFPLHYQWGRHSERRRLYLSKGVVPAVARWVADSLAQNLELGQPKRDSLVYGVGSVKRETKDGEVALFRGARGKWAEFLKTGEPPVREE